MEDMEEIEIESFNSKLPLNLIDISEGNVRISQQRVGLEELKTSIENFGLIHPIIVIKKEDRYELIVGQRRYHAFKELGRNTIPAIIIKPVNLTMQRIVSFGENIHRKKLPYNDTIRVCEELYKRETGQKFQRIEKIAKHLGISPTTVSKYLSYKLVPSEVQKLVENGKLSADVAYRVTTAFWPNTEKIIKIASYATRLTKSEIDRALDIGRKSAKISADEIVEEAQKPSQRFEIIIPVDRESLKRLEEIARERKTDVVNLVKNLIEEFIKEEALI